jgi:hypothetical protein
MGNDASVHLNEDFKKEQLQDKSDLLKESVIGRQRNVIEELFP